MVMSHVARTFVTRHCADLDAALRYARNILPGMSMTSIVTDVPASFASQDKVIGAHLIQLGPGRPWVLAVKGSDYSYIEPSIEQAVLTLYDMDLPETAVAYAVNNSVALKDIMDSQIGRVPFFFSETITVKRIIRAMIKHPYRKGTCTALDFSIHL